jgi:hypothetical protein
MRRRKDETIIRLSAADQLRFAEVVFFGKDREAVDPPEDTEALRRAQQRHAALIESS